MAQGTAPVVLSATLDTSVYVGELNSRGFGARIFTLAQTGVIRIDISDAILSETIRVLREKFGWDGYRLHDANAQTGWYHEPCPADTGAGCHQGRPAGQSHSGMRGRSRFRVHRDLGQRQIGRASRRE